jgi:hypothetical protein
VYTGCIKKVDNFETALISQMNFTNEILNGSQFHKTEFIIIGTRQQLAKVRFNSIRFLIRLSGT